MTARSAVSKTVGIIGIGLVVLVVGALLWSNNRLRADERLLERMVARPSISAARMPSSIRSVTFRYMGGYASFSPAYDIHLADDDAFVYNGYRDVPFLGVHRGRFEFALLAAWLDAQPLTFIGASVGGAVDYPSFDLVIERYRYPKVTVSAGLPIEDPEIWGILSALEGATTSVLTSHSFEHRARQ